MKFQIRSWSFLTVSALLVILLSSCANDGDVALEKALFLLDQGNYTEAVVNAREAVTLQPDNPKAKFVLATALIGLGFLGDGKTYLSKIADLLDAKASSGEEFKIFSSIAPSKFDQNRLTDLQEARDTLLSIDTGVRTPDVYLQLYVSRIFELAVAFSRIGANSQDSTCNADPSLPDRDGIPDLLKPNALQTDAATRFIDNLTQVGFDRKAADLPDRFLLNGILTKMANGVAASIAAANGDVPQGVKNFFIATFGDPNSTVPCTIPL